VRVVAIREEEGTGGERVEAETRGKG